jgi:hypothetical protein
MRKKILWFALGLAILGLGVWICYTFFEIVEDEEIVFPSREARINEYLALDRWLNRTGHPARVENTGDLKKLKAAREGTILIQADLFEWDEETPSYLESWVSDGGFLILCLGPYENWDNEEILGSFLESLGLEEGERTRGEYHYDPDEPSYGRNVFMEPEKEGALVLKDYYDKIRLVQLPWGKGKITVTGLPYFMTSSGLEMEQNARLSWYLLTGNEDKNGVYFIRGRREINGLFGQLFQRGNFFFIIVSGIVLIAAGFWAVIPVFGVVKENDERSGKALAERFLAEGRFLKSFGALDSYRDVYVKEIRRRLLRKENLRDEDEIENRIREAYPVKDFKKSIVILKTILERL